MKTHTRLEIFVKPQRGTDWQFHHIPQPNDRAQARRDARRLLKWNPHVAIVNATVTYEVLKGYSAATV